ncbi:PA14 domain-containing protein [Actinosynnema sp. CA-248983]
MSRSMYAEVYENPDGTQTHRQATVPMNVKEADGQWHPVDVSLDVDDKTKRVKAKRHPLRPTFAGSAEDPNLLSVETEDGARVSLGLERAKAAQVDLRGAQAGYRDVEPATDLEYEVIPSGVKEVVKLKQAPAPGKASWRFVLDTGGLTPRLVQDGVHLVDAKDTVRLVIPPVLAWDSAGTGDTPPGRTGGTYALERLGGSRWVLTVAVDEAWLREKERVYPVSVDPTFTLPVTEWHSYKSDGSETYNQYGLQIGSPLHNQTVWRTLFKFDYPQMFGRTVIGARFDVSNNRTLSPVDKTYGANLYHGTAFHFDGVGQHLAHALVGQVGSFSDPRLTQYLREKVDARDPYAWMMITGHEDPNVWTYKVLDATMTIDTGTAPPAPTLVGPAHESVSTSLTPTLAVNPVTDGDGDPVKYCFTVATGADAKSGVVVDSGCLDTPTWTVPQGVLQDGVTYTWQVRAYSGITPTPSPVWRFKVDQRIGERGPAPVDAVGPVSVNLANGNATVSVASPTFTTVGGTAGLSMTYNSQQQESKGLRASYFHDLSQNGNINAGQQPVLVRTEPQVNVDWGDQSPFAPVLAADFFVVRWEGFFQAPVTGTYQFAGVHDDGLKVWVNNNSVYDQPCCGDVNWAVAGNVNLTAGQRVPIKVELAEQRGLANLRLFVRTTDNTTVPPQIVPADWLYSQELPALPKGWTLSADLDGNGSTFTEAKVTDQNIVLTDGTGAKHTWTKKSTGGYTPPDGEDGVLALDNSGRITLTYGSEVFVFTAEGKLETQSSALDTRKPAALQNIYDGSPSRLREIKDPVSQRAHRLHYNRSGDDCYAGVAPPPGADAQPPAQMLCRIAYWDGTQTRLWYKQGRLFRIEDPGAEITDFSFTSNGLLDGVRDSRAADWVARDPATRDTDQANYLVHYVDHLAPKPLIRQVYEPKASPDVERGRHGYRYDAAQRTSYVDVDGVTPATGFFTKVVYDEAFRLLSTTDATGRTTKQTWSVKDQLLTATDAAGRMTTSVYDARDRLTDKYGPAPVSCFNGRLPTAACAATVPHTKTNYDEGINGLVTAFYDNRSLTGSPKVYQTGLAADGTAVRNWGAGAPTTGIPADNFSARLTGDIVFPEAGNYNLRVLADDGVRVWVDEHLLIDSWVDSPLTWRNATVNSPTAATARKIRLEYYENTVNAQLELHWTTPGGVQQVVPATSLRPRHDLTTSTVKAESHGVPDKATSTTYTDNGLDAAYGLQTSTVSAGLTTRTSYEQVGAGYLRRTGETAPTGAATAYVYYGDTEARDNPCTTEVDAVNQGGLAKIARLPAPASGAAREDEQVFDASGRVVAKGTSGSWTCTTYDERDRVVSVKYPGTSSAAERTVTTNHAVNGDPLVSSVSDHNGTVTTRVDLLGRVVEYTDANGVRTQTRYDRAGRAVSEKVTLPADAEQNTTYTHDDAGRVLTVSLNTTVLATATYDAAGELASVAYANGSSLASIGKDTTGQVVLHRWKTADNIQVDSAVGRTRAGTVIDETLGGVDARPSAPNYVYDAAGRLTEAWVAGHHYTYDFTSTADAACPTGTRANAGLNTNRMRLLDETVSGVAPTAYCYDAADRLLATVGAIAVTDVRYDGNGNTTQYTVGGATTHLSWDGADRNIALRTTGADPADVSYTRDATDRIIRRNAAAGDSVTEVRYGYTGSGDTAEFALGTDNKVLSRSVSLPGGVLYTWKPTADQTTFDHPTVRGDLSLTTGADGKQVGALRTYTPFGEPLKTDGTVDPDNVPDNQPGQMDHGWLGQHQRPYEHAGALSIVQMGARPYSPLLSRFLSVDPVEGGSANDYDYVNGDPVNTTDLDGRCPFCAAFVAGLRIGLFLFRKTTRVTKNFGRAFAKRTISVSRKAGPAVANAIRAGVRAGGRGLKTRVLETIRYVRMNPAKATFRCSVFGGLGVVLTGDKIGKIQSFATGCVANLIHDGWPTRR